MKIPKARNPPRWAAPLAAFSVLAIPLPGSAQVEGGAPTVAGAGTAQSRSWVEDLPRADWDDERQVRVRGGEPFDRVKFSVFCEELRGDFRWLLFKWRAGEPPASRSRWAIPLQVGLWGNFRDVHSGQDIRTEVEIGPDQRFLIRVEARLHDRFREEVFQRELVRALLIEQMLVPFARTPSQFTGEEVAPPEWIVHGFDQLIRHRRGGKPSHFYRESLEKGQFLGPQDLLAVKEPEKLDPVRQALFRASASVMVEALLNQPDGDLSMRAFLGDLGKPRPAAVDVLLRQHFPALREQDQAMEKWWALELASLGQQQGLEYLDRKETERLLGEALTLHFEAVTVATPVEAAGGRKIFDFLKPRENAAPPPAEAFSGTLDRFEEYLQRPGAREKLAVAFDRLQSLRRTGFPLYRPVISAYEQAIIRLARNETKDLAAEFAAADEMRRKVGDTLIRAEDFLNHFEATRAPRRSGEFDDYLELRRSLEKQAAPRRNDPISRHLDALEWEYR